MPAQKFLNVSRPVGNIIDTSNSSFPHIPSTQSLVPKQSDQDFHQIVPTDNSDNISKSNNNANRISRIQWYSVTILFFVNLINYMDRLTIAGVLGKIQKDYDISDAEAGALQTAFVISYMIFAPFFGYLGDRYSRRISITGGVMVWSFFTILGSFMEDYPSFLICRAMVGVGEASYSTIAPTIISDMFIKEIRSKMLAFFYFAIPVGCGLGYIVGSSMSSLADGNWRWGLRVTPFLGIIAVLLIIFALHDPPRGESEGHCNLKATTYWSDLCSLAKNGSFVYSTLAFTCVTFCTGALSWWGPRFVEIGLQSMDTLSDQLPMPLGSVAFVFGVVTMLSGIVGVPLGSYLSTTLHRTYGRADPLICAVGIFLSALFLFIGMLTANKNIFLAFLLLFLGEVALNLNWSIVADILLYVVTPTRRSTAEAFQILFSHAFGDAGSPYLIGLISDHLRRSLNRDDFCGDSILSKRNTLLNETNICDFKIEFYSLQYSMFTNNIVQILGGFMFLVTAIYIVSDKRRCRQSLIDTGKYRKYEVSLTEEDEAPQLRLIVSTPSFSSRRRTHSKDDDK